MPKAGAGDSDGAEGVNSAGGLDNMAGADSMEDADGVDGCDSAGGAGIAVATDDADKSKPTSSVGATTTVRSVRSKPIMQGRGVCGGGWVLVLRSYAGSLMMAVCRPPLLPGARAWTMRPAAPSQTQTTLKRQLLKLLKRPKLR